MPYVIDFRKPSSLEEVALFLGLEPELLQELIAASASGGGSPAQYFQHRIPKKRGGGFRLVWDIAQNHVRDAHRSFARRFADFAQSIDPHFPNSCTFGYVRGKSTRDNAEKHCGRKMLLRCDIKDFFRTITRDRVTAAFVEMGISVPAAEIFSSFATIEDRLPLGLNASPLIANLVCKRLDDKLNKLASGTSCVYTRYADDLAISGDTVPSLSTVADIVQGEGFSLSSTKQRITVIGQAHFVTGLSIADPSKPHIPRQFKRRLRQELYYCKRFGIQEHLRRIQASSYQRGINRLDGTVRLVAFVEDKVGPPLREKWRQILIDNEANVSYSPLHSQIGGRVSLIFDESEFIRDGKNHLAVACVSTDSIDRIRTVVEGVLRRHIVDPYTSGRKSALEKRGLHFADSPEELRTEFILWLPYLPFRVYLAFGILENPDQYDKLYLKLLNQLLTRRLQSNDRGIVSLYVEENQKIQSATVSNAVISTYATLEQRNDRRPITVPNVRTVGKLDEPALSLADSLLWVFGRYFAADDQTAELAHLRFERLRDKYRHIINVDSSEHFSRKHPIEQPRKRSRTSNI